MSSKTTGVIDVGGGMRGIYGAGVFDRCLDEGISFDLCCGISAGSANAASFLAKQKKRNYLFYHEYSFRKEYMSMGNFLKNGNYINLEYIYSVLSNSDGENPLDSETLLGSDSELCIVTTKAEDNTPVYFTKDDIRPNDYSAIKASCCIPVVCKPYEINGTNYYDGGLSDPLPIEKMLSMGCDRIVVILTRPIGYRPRENAAVALLAKRLLPMYPEVAKAIFDRHNTYDNSLKKALELRDSGKVVIISPDDCCGVDTLKRTPEDLDRLYNKGYSDAAAISEFLSKA